MFTPSLTRSKLQRALLLVAVAGAICLTAAGCGSTGPASAPSSAPRPSSSGTYYRLVQYPDAGFGGFYAQIAAAKSSIHMEMYELSDTTAEADLAAAAHRGVSVEVLLDKDFSGGSVNQAAYSYLRSRGVAVKWAPAGYIFHVKLTVFDGKTADVSTANLTSKYYATTRDAEVVDTDPADVRAAQATFAQDFAAGSDGTPAGDAVQGGSLIWSPDTAFGTAETALVDEINSAQHSVDFESEELSDRAIYNALAADARRGVTCEVLMTDSSDWTAGFDTVQAAGCKVHVFPDSSTALYIHEKAIVVDAGTSAGSLVVGSQNASRTSLTKNRELSVRLTSAHGGSGVLRTVATTFAGDFARAPAWGGTPAGGSSGVGGSGSGAGNSASGGGAPRSVASGAGSAGSGSANMSWCHPLTKAGRCYEAGEYCSGADHGDRGIAGDGEAIICEAKGSHWYWESA